MLGVCAAALAAAGPACRTLEAQTATVRIVAYNVKHGRGMDGRVDLVRIAEVLRRLDADIITLQEVDDRTERTGLLDQTGVLADHLGYQGFHGPHRPYQGGFYGNAVLTRLPVRETVTHAIPPASGSALSVHEVVVETPGGPLSVVSVHLAGSTEERLAQAEAVTARLAGRPHPVVLAGDFNGTPGGPVLTRLGADWTIPRKSGSAGTYPADAPDREIDFVMVRRRDAVEVLEHRVVEEPMASDHRPILAVVRLDAGTDPRVFDPGSGEAFADESTEMAEARNPARSPFRSPSYLSGAANLDHDRRIRR